MGSQRVGQDWAANTFILSNSQMPSSLITCRQLNAATIHMSLLSNRSMIYYPSEVLLSFNESESLSHVQIFANPWTVACQALLSMEFFRQEYWSVLQCPCLGYLPNPRTESRSLILQVDSLPFELPRNPLEYYHEHLMSALLKYFSNTYIFSQVSQSELRSDTCWKQNFLITVHTFIQTSYPSWSKSQVFQLA